VVKNSYGVKWVGEDELGSKEAMNGTRGSWEREEPPNGTLRVVW